MDIKKPRKKRSDRRHIVYQILCLKTGQQYFGITQGWRELDLKVRFQKHVWRALNEDKGWPLCNSIAKHGAENHVCDFVEVVRGKAQAHEIERELIALYKPKLNRTGRR